MMNTERLISNRAVLVSLMAMPAMVMTACSNSLAPSFEAMGVREIERDDARSVIEFTVRATNPNGDPIPLRRVSYRVQIDGVIVFEGVRSPETTLHTYSSHEFTLPAVLPSDRLVGSVDYALLGSVQYIPAGRLSEVLFDAEIKVPEAPLDLRGSIDAGT
jgi:hypothetical protein